MNPVPRVAIRADASSQIGTGHLRRCLSLGKALIETGAQVTFITRPHDAVAAQVFAGTGIQPRWLPLAPRGFVPASGAPQHAAWAGVDQQQDALETLRTLGDWKPDWVVVDHYAFDARWHGAIRDALRCRIMAIDDLADRALDADVLLDQNWCADHHTLYAAHLRREPRWLCGPRYALLDPAYRNAARYAYSEVVHSIGIFMGGTDPLGMSAVALSACRQAGFTGPVEVVSTSANPGLAALHQACLADGHTQLTVDAPDLAAFFARHDLQIGAGGSATWERCCVGAPTVAMALADNQRAVIASLASTGAVRATDEKNLADALRHMVTNPAARVQLSSRARSLVDGRGAQRVAVLLLRKRLQLRPATADDAALLHAWRNHPAVRTVSANKNPISAADHKRWLQAVLTDPTRWLFVAQIGELPVGSIRLDWLDAQQCEVSLYTDPELQGLGLGRHLLTAGEQALLARQPKGGIVLARVLPGNTVSQRLFEAAGYYGGPLQYHKPVGLRKL